MKSLTGTVSRGIKAPIIRQGDDVKDIVVDSLLKASEIDGFSFNDGDVVGVTEAIVARAQGNYVKVDDIKKDVENKVPSGEIGVIFPILSRNRFAMCLKGIAKGAKKITLMFSYPSDEVGNKLLDIEELDEKGINPWTDVLSYDKYRELFGYKKHTFTGVDYIEYYKELIENEGVEVEIVFSNDAKTILNYKKDIICCDIHSRKRSKKLLKSAGANVVLGLDDLMNNSVGDSGCNPNYGLLGSNKATEDSVKLFPVDTEILVYEIQNKLKEKTGKLIEVLVYGDGAFKDPQGHIWELADPVVSPGYTKGLEGTPNELKIKYLADNDFGDLKGEELQKAISKAIKEKDEKKESLVGNMASQGTTPRKLTDLIGSLCDLTSGSGDKGTPIIFIQGYFDNYSK